MTNPEDLHDFRPANGIVGRSIVVTGAAQGLGRVLARHLAARGAVVGAVDIQDPAETVALIEADGGSALSLRADVTSTTDMQSAADKLAGKYGRIDGLVNGAALFTTLERGPFTDLDLDEWDRTFAVNVKSVLISTRAVTPHFIEQRSGSIVNIASNVVSYGAADFLQYVSSKSAMIGMTRSLARELGPHRVRVNAVSPGLVTTDVTNAQRTDEYRQRVIDTQCITEPIRPRDVAEVVSFLLSDASRYVTGQNWLINGGSHMGPA